jgi:Na+/melibiose symporter-like transporter
VTGRDIKRRDVSKWFDTLLFTTGGLAGCLLFFLICFSTHEATSPNINIAWLNPLLLLLAVLPWFKKTRNAARWLHALNALVVALLMLAWPWQPQVGNFAFFPLMTALVTRSLANVLLGGQTTRGPTSTKG